MQKIKTMPLDTLLLTTTFAIFFVALLYSSVGHGGASSYLAIMALASIAPASLKPAALCLNILVAGIASYKYTRAGANSWQLLLPLLITSVPCAFLGGALNLPIPYYKIGLGIVLIYAAAHSFFTAKSASLKIPTSPNRIALLLMGGTIGFVSGLIGVGGGIFLSPLLLFLNWGETRKISGVAAVFILVNSIAGLIGLFTHQPKLPSELFYWAPAVLLGGFIGAELGSKYFSPKAIRQLMSVVLLVAGVKMLLPNH